MSRKTQIGSDSDTFVSPIGVFANARTSMSSRSDATRALKRRKTSGLNARFDSMLEDMSFCQQKPARRARSSGSSSVSSSYDIPRTPVDAYSQLSSCSLGQQFSVIKGTDQTGPSTPARCMDTLPSWLSGTIMTLDAHHPLRLLLPSPPPCFDKPANSSYVEKDNLSEEIIPNFAFSPDSYPPANTVLPSDHEPGLYDQPALSPSLVPRCSPIALRYVPPAGDEPCNDFESDADDALFQPLPFSTPGPQYSPEPSRSVSTPYVVHGQGLALHQPAPSASRNDPLLPLDSPPLNCLDFAFQTGHYSLHDPESAFRLDVNKRDAILSSPVHEFPASNPVPFSTPGPVYSLTSCDPLAEDILTDPDSLQLADEPDGETLDFRWQPFDRKGPASESTSPSPFRYYAN